MAACHASSFVGTVSLTALGSMLRNQHRSQLSVAYWTMFRKGGEVTTSATESAGICGVESAGLVNNCALAERLSSLVRIARSTSPSSWRDFLRMILATSRGGGTWLRFRLIFSWDLTETAWLGGSV